MTYINYPTKVSDTVFVYVCPGRFEESAGLPCAGQTGVMNGKALPFLHALRPDIFPFLERYDYMITNVWPSVEYKAKTNRSVPTAAEVAAETRTGRLMEEIRDKKYVVACGNLAHIGLQICIRELQLKGQVAFVRHTSRQALGCPTDKELCGVLQAWSVNLARQLQ